MAHRVGVAVAVVVSAVLLGAVTGIFISQRDKRPVADPPAGSTLSSPPVSSPASPSPSPTPSPTRDPRSALPASAPLNDQVIVWPRMHNGNWDIALLDLRNGKVTPLTKGGATDWGPVISANRRTIMYTRIVDERPTLRVMAANGKGDRLLFKRPLEECFRLSRPAEAPRGQLVVTCNTEAAPSRSRLLVITLNGMIVRQLDKGRIGDPTVSPGGKWVLYWRSREGNQEGGALYRIALDGKGSRVRLSNGADSQDADPAVSPDGGRLAFSRRIGTRRVLMTVRFDGKAPIGNPRRRTDGINDQDLSWSPDGRQIAYKHGPSDNGDLYVVDLASGKSRRVVDNPEPDTVPAWTPR